MKIKKRLTAAVMAILLAATALPTAVLAEAKSDEKELTKVTLNEVAHSVFYAPQYVAIEKGYFADQGLDVELVTGFGADKVLTALISGEADIGFMGAEASIYAYQEGATDPAVNFAQLTQRAGNFLVAREEMTDFQWSDLKGKKVLGGRKGGMPEMVFEYILKQNGLDPQKDLSIDQSIDFGSTAAAFAGDDAADFTVEFEPSATALEKEGTGHVVASLGVESGYVPYTSYSAKTSYLKEHPDRFTRMSITDISEDIGTSIAAITRFVKKMGYDKLQDLKLAITRDMEASESSQYVRVEEDDDILTVSKKVLQKNIETIEDIGKIIREDDLEEAFQIIRDARRVIFTGVGGSASVAQDAYHKFMRIGMMVELITDVHTQAVVSSVGNEEDAIIVVSNEGANTELNAALKVAKENRMKIIAITQFSQSPLTKLADVCLYTLSRNFSYKPQSLISRIAEYSLVDVLYVGFCMQSQDTVAEKLLEISTNMKKFKNYND